jgi:hypothetical protein
MVSLRRKSRRAAAPFGLEGGGGNSGGDETITDVFQLCYIQGNPCLGKEEVDIGLGKLRHMTRLGGIDGDITNHYL